MKKIIAVLILSTVTALVAFAAAPYYNVMDYGAKADGKTLTTKALQHAIDACDKAGGGKVIFPAGKYLTSSLFLHSHVEVEILSGAVIIFDDNIEATPIIDGSWEGIDRKVYASLFVGHDLEDVTISGRGVLDGQGKKWWDAFRETDKLRTAHNIREREPENPAGSPLKVPRPRMINFYNCKNVVIRGVKIINSPAWTIHPVYCENVNIEDISIIQPYESPNTDGIDPEACRNVRIRNCFVDCGDDCITIKSGYNEHGRKKGIPCDGIVISDCIFAHGRSAIGIGSEMSGGVRNVIISNCVFKGTLRGLRIKSGRPRGGMVENYLANNIIMENVQEGISIDMYYEGAVEDVIPVTEETPFFKNIRFSNIIGHNINKAVNIFGLPEAPVEGVVMENIKMDTREGVNCKFATDINFRNVEINNNDGKSAFLINKSTEVIMDNIDSKTVLQNPVIKVSNSKNVLIKNCNQSDSSTALFQTENCQHVETVNNTIFK